MHVDPPRPEKGFTVRLSHEMAALFTLLASAASKTVEQYAEELLRSHCEKSLSDDGMMALVGRALISNRAPKAAPPLKPAAETKRPASPKKAVKNANKPDGLPKGYSRTKNGDVISHGELRKATYTTEEVAQLLNTSPNTIARALEEKAVIPFGYVGSARFPRFRELEVDQIDNWLKTPCSKGPAARNVRCSKCGRYFSRQGIRVHELHCDGGRATQMKQR